MDAACDVASPQHGFIPDAYCLGSRFLLLRKNLHSTCHHAVPETYCVLARSKHGYKQLQVNTLNSSRVSFVCSVGNILN